MYDPSELILIVNRSKSAGPFSLLKHLSAAEPFFFKAHSMKAALFS